MKHAVPMNRRSILSLVVATLSTPVMAMDPLAEAFTGLEATASFRYRLESVDQTGKEDALASTLKSRLTAKTKPVYQTVLLLEVDNVTVVGSDNYNDLSGDPARAAYATVVDPTYTEVNQVALSYQAPAATTLTYGRQRILLDNQRLVGGVGWRQNEQTYDGFTVSNKVLDRTTLFYGYVYNVNTIRATDIDGGRHHLLNANYVHSDALGVTGYAYLLDDISDTFGVQAKGKVPLQSATAHYLAEFARQDENGSVASFSANYLALEGGLEVQGITGKVGYELQESDSGRTAFRTPLGTNHAFNGWADLFLVTPANGLEDLYLSAETARFGPKLTLTWHDFSADEGGGDYGSEIDLAVAQKFATHYTALLKLADFSSDNAAYPDTTKIWLQLEATF